MQENKKSLRMTLIQEWFEMTDSGVKKEDYREMTPYYMSRFCLYKGKHMKQWWWENVFDIYDVKHSLRDISFKQFDVNVMMWGYPSKHDVDKIIKLEHKGIEIRTGNPDWGAVPGVTYLVVMHGEILK